VADGLTAYLNGVQERLHQAELAHAAEAARTKEAEATAAQERKAREAAQARAVAERRARRLTLALAVSVVLALTLGGGGWLWVKVERDARQVALNRDVNEALNAMAHGELDRAREQAQRALTLFESGPADAALKDQVTRWKAELDAENYRRWLADYDRHNALGRALALKGQWDEATACYKKIIELYPKDAWAHFNLGAALYHKGQVDEAIASYKKAMAFPRSKNTLAGLDDTSLFIKVAALQAWFGQDKELAETCRWGLGAAQHTGLSAAADVVAKACCILPSTDQARLAAALVLGRKAIQLDKGGSQTWSQMALGMAEYRSGHFAAADAALITAEKNAKNTPDVPGMSALSHVAVTW
jgi:tetratricopeptide (TPR) repeat protein